MSDLVIPANLRRISESSADLRHWIARLPSTVARLAERWSLRVGEPFQPGGYCSWVAPVTDAAGRNLVMKVGWWHDEAAHEAAGLRLWDGDGAVTLHDAWGDATTSALLLERCSPGTPLATARPEREQDVVIAALLRRLWRRPPDGHPFRPLHEMCDRWADSFEQQLARVPGHLDPGLARAGMELFRTLPRTSTDHVLLCTDLHADNILAAERETWLVIDPKPYLGDPAYDPLQRMIHHRHLTGDPHALITRMADLLGLDVERLTQWLFARCVRESIHSPQLREVAVRLAPS